MTGESLDYDDDRTPPQYVNPNFGHGHVHPRPDGMKARCGGPAICRQCSQEAVYTVRAARIAKRRD